MAPWCGPSPEGAGSVLLVGMERELGAVLDAVHEEGYEIWEIRGAYRWGVVMCPGCVAYHDIPVRPRRPDRHRRRITEFAARHRPHVGATREFDQGGL